jgi:hypothetical protein
MIGNNTESESTMCVSLNEVEVSLIVQAGGGKYVGILKEIPGRLESIVLYISPQTKTTLGLPVSQLTVEAVREQLAESNAAFTNQVRDEQ